jgi:AcrR family transcriptional regulator
MPAGLRERKKQQTRIALSWAAIQLIVERGYSAVRIEDIAEAAGVSVRTFGNYFSSKAEAVAARHLDRVLLVADELRARPASEPLWTSLTAAIEAHFALGTEAAGEAMPSRTWQDGVRLMVTEPALLGELYRANSVAAAEISAAVAERTGTDPTRDIYPKLVAAVFGAALGTVMEHWIQSEQPVPFGPLLRRVLDQIAVGLPTPPAQKE